jgi:hypothetical protein
MGLDNFSAITKSPPIIISIFLQFDRNVVYLGRSCAHSLDRWDSAKMSEKTVKNGKKRLLAHLLGAWAGCKKWRKKHEKNALPTRWASGGVMGQFWSKKPLPSGFSIL